MALPSIYGIEKKMNSMEGLSAYENGGKGSGNFGHAGRPGKVGGSGNGGVSTPSKGGAEKDTSLTKAREAEKKAQKEYYDYVDEHGYDRSDEAKKLFDTYSDAKAIRHSAEQEALYDKVPKAKEMVKGETELKSIIDKDGLYTTGIDAGQIVSKLDDYSKTFEADTEGFYSRKSKDLTKKVLEGASELQKMARDISGDKKLSKDEKRTLIDSVAAVYSVLGSSLFSGGKIRADDTFTASRAWSMLDGANGLTGKEAKKYSKKLQDLGSTAYDVFKSKENDGKRFSWSELLNEKD